MRTWKQGRIGKIKFPDSNLLYIKCLRYPLAQFYLKFDIKTKNLESPLFISRLEKSTLRYIETIEQHNLDKDEKIESSIKFETYDINQLWRRFLLEKR